MTTLRIGDWNINGRSSRPTAEQARLLAGWAPPKFAVGDVSYDYEAAKDAGSDHALVRARIELGSAP